MPDTFQFDGLNPAIRTILDESFRQGSPSFDYAELKRFIVPVQFDRDLTANLLAFRALVEAVMAKQEFKSERSKSDGWLAPRIHNALRLTRREAARKEFWIGLIFQNLDYLWWRFEVSEEKPVGLDRVLGSDSRLAFAQIWWAAELIVESNYSLVETAAKSSDLGMYFQPLNLLHSKPFAISISNKSFDKSRNHEFNINITKKFNFSINCFVRDDIAPSVAPDMNAIRRWRLEKPDLDSLLSDDLTATVPYRSTREDDLKEMQNFVEFVANLNSKP